MSDFWIDDGCLTKYNGSDSEVVIPYGVNEIYDFAFEYNRRLRSIRIPPTVQKIGEAAFRGCTGLTEVTIPSSVWLIRRYAFDDCTSLTRVVFEGSQRWKTEYGKSFRVNDPYKNVEYLTETYLDDAIQEE